VSVCCKILSFLDRCIISKHCRFIAPFNPIDVGTLCSISVSEVKGIGRRVVVGSRVDSMGALSLDGDKRLYLEGEISSSTRRGDLY